MNDTIVTVQGWLGNHPDVREAAGVPVANFRVACTPRRLRRSTGEWVDGQTQWYGVSAWRQLAEHCGRSLRCGDPVILQGRLNQRTYVNKSGVEVTAMEIDLITIGHDLSRGISVFNKTVGAQGQQRQVWQQRQEAERAPWEASGGRDGGAAVAAGEGPAAPQATEVVEPGEEQVDAA